MIKEIAVAVEFLSKFLYNNLPRRRVMQLLQTLEDELKARFEHHWHPEDPERGSAYRSLKFDDSLDPVVRHCAKKSGVPVEEILTYLPEDLHLWIDPNCVSFRSGERSALQYLFYDGKDLERELPPPRAGFNDYGTESTPPVHFVPCTHFKLSRLARNVKPSNLTRLGGKIVLDCDADETSARQSSPSRRPRAPHRGYDGLSRFQRQTQTGKIS